MYVYIIYMCQRKSVFRLDCIYISPHIFFYLVRQGRGCIYRLQQDPRRRYDWATYIDIHFLQTKYTYFSIINQATKEL